MRLIFPIYIIDQPLLYNHVLTLELRDHLMHLEPKLYAKQNK